MTESLNIARSAGRLTVLVRAGGIDALISGGDGPQFFSVDVDPAITSQENTLE